MNQVICDSKVSEMRVLELLGVDEYYQTISTWMRIMDEKNNAIEKATGKSSDTAQDDGKQRRKLKGK